MIVPEVPEFVINPENLRMFADELANLALMGGGFGAAAAAFTVGCYEVIKQTIKPAEIDLQSRIRFANTALTFGGVLGGAGTVVVALMFSR